MSDTADFSPNSTRETEELQVQGPWFLIDDRTAVCPLCGANINHYYRPIHVNWHIQLMKEKRELLERQRLGDTV